VSDAIHAEWTKLRTLTATWWLLACIIAVTVAISAAVASSIHISPGAPGSQDPTKLALIGVAVGQAVVAAVAVLAVGEEYGTGMIHLTLSAMPRRELVLASKALTVAALVLIAAVPAVAGCLIIGRLMLPAAGLDPAHGYPLVSIASGATLRAAGGSVLYLGLIAALSVGVATVVRDTAVATGAVLALLYLPVLLTQLVSGSLHRDLERLAPMSAGLAIQTTRNLDSLPVSPWEGLAILCGWVAGVLLIGLTALKRRDT
jgi:ABC-2 type transport system permease protein